MARENLDLAELARSVRQAYLAVNAAIPLPFAEAGVVETSPQEEHLMELRAIAFGTALGELLEFEYAVAPVDLAALERGTMPSVRKG